MVVVLDHKVDWGKGYGIEGVERERTSRPDRCFKRYPSANLFQRWRLSLPRKTVPWATATRLLTSWRLAENELTVKRPVTPRMLLSQIGGLTVHGFPGYLPADDLLELTQILNRCRLRVLCDDKWGLRRRLASAIWLGGGNFPLTA